MHGEKKGWHAGDGPRDLFSLVRGDLYKWIIIIHPRRCALRLAQLFSLPLSQIHRTFNLRLSDFLIACFPRSHSAVPNRSSPPKQRQKEYWDLCWATSHTKKVPPFIKISHLFIDGEGVPVSYNSISFSRTLEKGDAECSSKKIISIKIRAPITSQRVPTATLDWERGLFTLLSGDGTMFSTPKCILMAASDCEMPFFHQLRFVTFYPWIIYVWVTLNCVCEWRRRWVFIFGWKRKIMCHLQMALAILVCVWRDLRAGRCWERKTIFCPLVSAT